MKINKIAKLCKEAKKICVLLTDDGPWIGTAAAIYFVPELQGISPEGIYTVLNISEKDRKSIAIEYLNAEDVDVLDINEAAPDVPTKLLRLNLLYSGVSLRTLIGNNGVIKLYQTDYAAPLSHEAALYFRGDRIYAKKGMVAQAIIMPYRECSEELLTQLEYIQDHIRETLLEKK